MAFDKSFSISELTVGSLANIIGIDDDGNMTFTDGAVETITLQTLAGLAENITFDSLVDTTGAVENQKYNLRKTELGWKTEIDGDTEGIVVEIEITDWVADGDNWTVDVPHNLNLTLPTNLMFVQVWDASYTEVNDTTITQGANAVTIVSPTQSLLYVTMR